MCVTARKVRPVQDVRSHTLPLLPPPPGSGPDLHGPLVTHSTAALNMQRDTGREGGGEATLGAQSVFTQTVTPAM